MNDYVIETEIVETEAGIFRIEIHPDDDPMSPRDADNVGEISISHRDVVNVDGVPVQELVDAANGGRVSLRAVCRFLRMDRHARVALPVQVNGYEHTYSALSPDDDGARVDGFTYDTPEGRAVLGDAPTDEEITVALTQEVEAYSRWVSGEYVWYSIERLDRDPVSVDVEDVEDDPESYEWDVVDSLSSIDDLAYAREDARDTVNRYTAADFPSPALAAQV